MPRPKLSRDEKKVREQVRLKPKECELALEMLETWDFKTRSHLYRWCIMLGLEVMSGSPAYLQRLDQLYQRKRASITDPNQRDMFDDLMLKSQAVSREKALEGKKIIEEFAEDLNQ